MPLLLFLAKFHFNGGKKDLRWHCSSENIELLDPLLTAVVSAVQPPAKHTGEEVTGLGSAFRPLLRCCLLLVSVMLSLVSTHTPHSPAGCSSSTWPCPIAGRQSSTYCCSSGSFATASHTPVNLHHNSSGSSPHSDHALGSIQGRYALLWLLSCPQ